MTAYDPRKNSYLVSLGCTLIFDIKSNLKRFTAGITTTYWSYRVDIEL